MCALVYALFVYMVRVSRRAKAWWILVSHSQRASESTRTSHYTVPHNTWQALYSAQNRRAASTSIPLCSTDTIIHEPSHGATNSVPERCVFRRFSPRGTLGGAEALRRAGAVCLAGRWASRFRGAIIHQLPPAWLAVVYQSGQLLPPAG